MSDSAGGVQFTSLLDNDVIGRIERMRLNPSRRLTNRSHGEHLAGKGGTSTEFSDYRDYVPGDDVRYVDWNIFSRLNRPYLKLYQHEEEMHVAILVDASTSMLFENKLLRARQLAAAFGIMGFMNYERVSVHVAHQADGEPRVMPPCTGRINFKRMFEFLESIEGGGDAPIESSIEAMLRRHRGRGIAIILSDFLSMGNVQRAMNMLFSAGLETFAIQILGPSEIEPEVTGDLRFVDSETGGTLDISSAGDLLGLYHELRLSYEDELALICRQRNGRFMVLNSTDSVEWLLFDALVRRGWIQ